MAGTSGGYLHHILATQQSLHPASTLTTTRGRNADVVEYTLQAHDATPLFRAARFYGFRNIQNLVRKLKPPKASRLPGARTATARGGSRSQSLNYDYVEVMACPGGCTNGGGQLRAEDAVAAAGNANGKTPATGPKEWLARVDEAYFSAEDEDEESSQRRDTDTDMDADTRQEDDDGPGSTDLINGISPSRIRALLNYWAASTNLPLRKLVTTSFRAVESDVGKGGGGQVERVVELAGKVGGGW